MLHGSDTWPIRKENEVALQRAEMRMVRWNREAAVDHNRWRKQIRDDW